MKDDLQTRYAKALGTAEAGLSFVKMTLTHTLKYFDTQKQDGMTAYHMDELRKLLKNIAEKETRIETLIKGEG